MFEVRFVLRSLNAVRNFTLTGELSQAARARGRACGLFALAQTQGERSLQTAPQRENSSIEAALVSARHDAAIDVPDRSCYPRSLFGKQQFDSGAVGAGAPILRAAACLVRARANAPLPRVRTHHQIQNSLAPFP